MEINHVKNPFETNRSLAQMLVEIYTSDEIFEGFHETSSKAIRIYEDLLENDPKNVDIMLEFAKLLYVAQNNVYALSLLGKVVELSPSQPQSYFTSLRITVNILWTESKYEECIHCLKPLTQQFNKYFDRKELVFILARLYDLINQKDTSIFYLQEFAGDKWKISIADPNTWITYGRMWLHKNQDYSLASDAYYEAIKRYDYPSSELYYTYTIAACLSNRRSSGIKAIDCAIKIDPYNSKIRVLYQKLQPQQYSIKYAIQDSSSKLIQANYRKFNKRRHQIIVNNMSENIKDLKDEQEEYKEDNIEEKVDLLEEKMESNIFSLHDFKSEELFSSTNNNYGLKPSKKIKPKKIFKPKNLNDLQIIRKINTKSIKAKVKKAKKNLVAIENHAVQFTSISLQNLYKAIRKEEMMTMETIKNMNLYSVQQLEDIVDQIKHIDEEMDAKYEKHEAAEELLTTKLRSIIQNQKVNSIQRMATRQASPKLDEVKPLWCRKLEHIRDVLIKAESAYRTEWRSRVYKHLKETKEMYQNLRGETECHQLLVKIMKRNNKWSSHEFIIELDKIIECGLKEECIHNIEYLQASQHYEGFQKVKEKQNKGKHIISIKKTKSDTKVKNDQLDLTKDEIIKRELKKLLSLNHGRENISEMKSKYHSLLLKCSNSGNYEKASLVLDTMQAKGIQPDAFSYQLLILCCKNSQPCQAAQAENIYHRMIQKGIMPTASILNILLSIFNLAGHWRRAVALFQEVKAAPYNVVASTLTFEALAKACTNAPLNDAPEVYEALKFAGVPEFLAYSTSCAIIKEYKLEE